MEGKKELTTMARALLKITGCANVDESKPLAYREVIAPLMEGIP